ncbi:hypothetical protein K9O30_06295 [Clostridium bowmanii]|uniref:hypothetical protein n=1 Tax=Clostridium bowmanii TaxID=132925 RepID=UPI001C0E80FA|nr:hypothetical protein [Clostridium bowmanii]MBU3188770.1 hypothetical protein [Clostridium bowmanii]MCA1073354.1 hypothetical protein [Clostridium bowmanii]
MEHKNLILDLLEDVSTLKKIIGQHEMEITSLKNSINYLSVGLEQSNLNEHSEENDGSGKTRVSTLKSIIYCIEKFNLILKDVPNAKVRKTRRAENCDVIINTPNNVIQIRVFTSKSYSNDHAGGWHRISKSKVSDINVFIIEFKDNYSAFILTKDELIDLMSHKLKDSLDLYHFYFNIKNDANGKLLLTEERDGIVSASDFFENWTLINNFIN